MRPLRFSTLLVALAFLLALHVFSPPLRAEEAASSTGQPEPTSTADDLIAKLPGASFNEKGKIVEQLAATGDTRVTPILRAMVDGDLYTRRSDKKLVIGADTDTDNVKLKDALTGADLGTVDSFSVDKVRVNNHLRRIIRSAIAQLTLSSPDPAVRLKAAQTALDTADPDALPDIDAALKKETNADVRLALQEVHAAIVLKLPNSSEKDRLAAVEILRKKGDADARSILFDVNKDSGAAVYKAARSAISSIDTTLEYWSAAQTVWYGLSLGSVLLLAAIGLAITFGVMGVINMAHGEMVMLGAYTTFVIQQFLQSYAPSLLDWSLIVAVPAAFLVSGGVGVLVERTIIRWLYGRPLETLLATWGLSLILQQAVRSIFGPTNQQVVSPTWMSGAFDIGQLEITYNRLVIVIFSLVVFALLMAFLKFTPFGLQTRAVTQNRSMASAMGIRTDWIDALTFGLGSGIAGMAGVALSQIDNVSPNLGQSYIIDSFMVVVFGGVGNLWGTLVGAGALGVANKVLEPYAGAVLGKIFVLVFIILFIQRRPRGLFALKGRAVEA